MTTNNEKPASPGQVQPEVMQCSECGSTNPRATIYRDAAGNVVRRQCVDCSEREYGHPGRRPMRRPPNRPTCRHGKQMGERCDECGRGRQVA